MNQHIRALPDDFLTYANPRELHEAIDRVATMRARVVRIGLFGTLLFRPDPSGVYTQADHPRLTAVLREEVETMVTVCNALTTGLDLPETRSDITVWLHTIAIEDRNRLTRILNLGDLSARVGRAIDGDLSGLGDAVNEHMRTARDGFFDDVTALCNTFWNAIYASQADALEQATNTASALAHRLSRLEHIGRHVRLVSLNASVEAARAGSVGKGLMVIAQEFKELAEEIQTLATEAQGDIDRIS